MITCQIKNHQETLEGKHKKERGYNTVIHHRTNLLRHTNIPRLLKELPNSTLLRRLACIDKTSRNFNDDLVDRGSVLLLQK
jgi:predicted N-acyltransferase